MEDEQKYVCNLCKYTTNRKSDYLKHRATIKHLKQCENNTPDTLIEKYYCEKCDFLTYRRFDWNRHMQSSKHSKIRHICKTCKREYKYKKKYDLHIELCKNSITDINHIEPIQHATFICENVTITNHFNVNVYLNSEYGDAINIGDFRKEVTLSLDDLLYTKQNGYAKGISKIFIKKMEELGPCHRPIHCNNSKEPQFFVRDDNNWIEDTGHNEINMAIDSVACAQIGKIKEWEKINPYWSETNEGQKEYIDIVKCVLNGSTSSEQEKNNKLIKRNIRENIEIDVPLV
jgi:hypothetical protein